MVSSVRDLPITHGDAQRLQAAAARQAPLDNLVDMVTPMLERSRRRRRTLGEWVKVNGRRCREIAAATVGVAAPTVAAFEWHLWAGLLALGISALLWEKLSFASEDVPGSHRGGTA